MKLPKLFPVLLVLLMASCGGQVDKTSESYSPQATDKATDDSTSVKIDEVADINSPTRKIIKTADVRCRVDDVYKATEHLETLVKNVGGQISESRLENQQNQTKSESYSSDSLKEITVYTTTSHLTLKVPVASLDSVLHDIPAVASFIDTRHLKLDDVTYQYLDNQLKNEAANEVTAKAQKRPKKSADAGVSAYDDQRNDTQIDRKINNLQIQDQVRYATLTVDLYQPSRIDIHIIADTDRLSQPGFGYRLKQSLLAGWEFIEAAFLVLIRVWPLVLIAIVVVLLVRRKKPLLQHNHK